MKRIKYFFAMAGGALLVGTCAASAQQQAAPPPPPPALDVLLAQGTTQGELAAPPLGERVEVLGLEGMHPGKVVTGAPFSAVATSETTQTLVDGNHITRTTQTNLYRDSQGRFRKEGSIKGFGLFAGSGKAKPFVMIHDPVAGTSYVLEPDNKTARELPRLGRLTEFLREERSGKRAERLGNEPNTQVEDLGTQTIAGVQAQGKRVTHTIPAGEIGNDKPIVSFRESWYSPDLQIVVMSKRSDPRFGETSYTVTNIQRGEPAASLFTVPSDYTLQPRHEHGRHRFGRPGAPPAPGESPAAPPPAEGGLDGLAHPTL